MNLLGPDEEIVMANRHIIEELERCGAAQIAPAQFAQLKRNMKKVERMNTMCNVNLANMLAMVLAMTLRFFLVREKNDDVGWAMVGVQFGLLILGRILRAIGHSYADKVFKDVSSVQKQILNHHHQKEK